MESASRTLARSYLGWQDPEDGYGPLTLPLNFPAITRLVSWFRMQTRRRSCTGLTRVCDPMAASLVDVIYKLVEVYHEGWSSQC
jgi:hypothetical protein